MDGWQRNFDASPDAGNEPRASAFAAAPIKVVITDMFAILALMRRPCQPPISDRIDPGFVAGSMLATMTQLSPDLPAEIFENGDP